MCEFIFSIYLEMKFLFVSVISYSVSNIQFIDVTINNTVCILALWFLVFFI